MRLTRLNIHPNTHKGLCGLIVALVLATLPLPAFATDTDTSDSSTTPTSQSAPADTNSTSQSTVSNAVNDTSATLQTATAVDPLPAINLSGSEPTANANNSSPDASVAVHNSLTSDATSGSADVTKNIEAGNATSGNAAATATVLNVANANGLTAGNFKTFECDVTGDVQDNLVIDPTSLLPICKTTSEGSPNEAGKTQSLQSGASLVDILNDIVLSTASGDASVIDNTKAGDATTGDAAALANIVNIANTAIGAKNSFLGVINIYGNLKGDILVPQSLVDSLIGSTGSSIPAGSTAINNTIDASAASGEANVKNNTVGGDATTGDAATSLTVLNLTGQEVVAKNSLLVFVNVLGKWMGMIVPAPGSNTAMLGSDVQSSSTATSISDEDHAGDSTTNITNNITVKAKSGDANVSGNMEAGNATSGKAQAGVNLLNITNSNFWLDDWFGALFINVLGSWLGDFDIQASAPVTPTTPTDNAQPIQDVRVYQFAEAAAVKPAVKVATAVSTQGNDQNRTDITEESTPTGAVLATSTTDKPTTSSQAVKAAKLDLFALVAIVMALTLLIAVITMVFRRWHTEG